MSHHSSSLNSGYLSLRIIDFNKCIAQLWCKGVRLKIYGLIMKRMSLYHPLGAINYEMSIIKPKYNCYAFNRNIMFPQQKERLKVYEYIIKSLLFYVKIS